MAFVSFSSQLVIDNTTAVSNVFLEEHLPQCNGDCARVYLYGLYLCGSATRYDNTLEHFSNTLNLEQDEAKHVQDVLKLSRTEVRSITQFERGEALISNNNNKVPVIVKTSKSEQKMITTDRSELAALLNEKQNKK